MGRKAAVTDDIICKVLKNLDIFHENGKLKTEIDSVWKTACAQLNQKVK